MMRAVLSFAIIVLLPVAARAEAGLCPRALSDAALAQNAAEIAAIALNKKNLAAGKKRGFLSDQDIAAVRDRLQAAPKHIAPAARRCLDLDLDGEDEIIVWSEGLAAAAASWLVREFVLVLDRGSQGWRVAAKSSYLYPPTPACDPTGSCAYRWRRFSSETARDGRFPGAVLTAARFGPSGRTFQIRQIRYNRYDKSFAITAFNSPHPLVISPEAP